MSDSRVYINKEPISIEIAVPHNQPKELYQKMLETWCSENCTGGWHITIGYMCQGMYSLGTALFSEEADAVNFKLTWSEEPIGLE